MNHPNLFEHKQTRKLTLNSGCSDVTRHCLIPVCVYLIGVSPSMSIPVPQDKLLTMNSVDGMTRHRLVHGEVVRKRSLNAWPAGRAPRPRPRL